MNPVLSAVLASLLALACMSQNMTTATPLPEGQSPPAATPANIQAAADSDASESSSQVIEFGLDLLDGGSMHLSDLRGQIVVLNFWASWCAPCVWELPAFETVWQEYRDRGVVFLGVAVSDFSEEARDFAARAGVTYPLGMDADGQIGRDYRVYNVPTTYVIDREGNVAKKLVGAVNEAALRIFLNGQLDEG